MSLTFRKGGGDILFLLLCLFQSCLVSASCNTETESHVYGDTFTCAVTLHIEHHCNVVKSDTYTVYAIADGITGPTVRYTSKTDAKINAVYKFFEERNVSCNCQLETAVLDECAVAVKNCWNFKDSADVSSNYVQYESWTNHSDISGYYCCDHDMNVSQRLAVEVLKNVVPQCFTALPTAIPTPMPTIEEEDCKGPIPFDGTRCLSGFNRSSLNPDVCCKCPYPTAGHDGHCEPCKSGTEPTSLRISCEAPATFWDSAGGDIMVATIGAAVGALVTVPVTLIVERCLSKKCKKESNASNAQESVPMVRPNTVPSEEY